jgi:hypothetical protein
MASHGMRLASKSYYSRIERTGPIQVQPCKIGGRKRW